jgi:hypothetical protein
VSNNPTIFEDPEYPTCPSDWTEEEEEYWDAFNKEQDDEEDEDERC